MFTKNRNNAIEIELISKNIKQLYQRKPRSKKMDRTKYIYS